MDSLFGLTPVDLVALAVLIFAGAMGLSNGLVHSVLFIAAWIAAGIATWKLSPDLVPEVKSFVASEQVAQYATYLGVFVITLTILTIVAGSIGKAIRNGPMRIPDKMLGLAFGAVCGGLILSTALLLYEYIAKPNPMPLLVTKSYLYPVVKDGKELIEEQLPESFKTRARALGKSGTPEAPPDPGGGTPPAAPKQ